MPITHTASAKNPSRPGSPRWTRRLPLLAAVTIVALVGSRTAAAAPVRPNVVVVLADDLGYGDLACYGNDEMRTPHLDRFAMEGLRLTACYSAAANCSPARAGLMTGRTPQRAGIHNWIPMLSPMHLRASETTIASHLRSSGYQTCHVGKWHLNGRFNLDGQPQPGDHGFDHWFATQNNALPNHHDPDNFVRNGSDVGKLEGYSGPLVAAEADRWLRTERDAARPFFLFCCFHEPHEPIATDPEFSKLYPSDDPSYSAHHGNITQLDAAFGSLLKSLDDLGLADSTFVLFTSDNGPAVTGIHPHGSAGPFRLKKGHLYEGGIRIPGLVRWPGHTKPGSTSDLPTSGLDVFPTLCAMTGVEPPADRPLDGQNVLPLYEGRDFERTKPLYWHFHRASSAPKVALRDGDWKLLATLTGRELTPTIDMPAGDQDVMRSAELDTFELYDLENDPAETNDLSGREPERLRTLRTQLEKLFVEVRDESPVWPDWISPRYESQRIVWPPYRKQGGR